MESESSVEREQSAAVAMHSTGRNSKSADHRMAVPIPAIVTFILIMLSWQLGVVTLNPPAWLIPAPSEVALALYNGFAVDPTSTGGYYIHVLTTLQESLSGWVIGSILGILLGAVMSQLRIIERMLLPFVNMSQTIPKIALAPLLLVWFGLGIESKIALVITSAFFPVFLNTLVAFKSTEQDLLDMMRSLGATRLEIVRRILLPNAVPMIFVGLELALLHSFLGAVAGEFVGARAGVGVLLLQRSHTLDTAGIFALLIILASIGWFLDSVLLAVRGRVLFWSPIERGQVTV
jgi:NitT/TauT family transport system permease protein